MDIPVEGGKTDADRTEGQNNRSGTGTRKAGRARLWPGRVLGGAMGGSGRSGLDLPLTGDVCMKAGLEKGRVCACYCWSSQPAAARRSLALNPVALSSVAPAHPGLAHPV